MAEAAAAKKSRTFKMGAFTKKQNNLKKVLSDDASPLGMAQEAYDALGEAYKDLEKAHEAYYLVAEDADIENEGDYLLIPSNSLTETQTSFHKFKDKKNKDDEEEKDRNAKKVLTTMLGL